MSHATPQPFAHAEMVASVVLTQDGQYLLVQEGQGKAKGRWNFPGGRVDTGETLEAAAHREAQEEVGLTVTNLKQLYVFHIDADEPVLHAYAADITGSQQLHVAQEEILDAQWFSYEQIVEMKPQLRSAHYILGSIERLRATA